MKHVIFALVLFLAADTILAQDPVRTDPDKYRVTFENERVRVLEYKDKPGAVTTKHRHPDSVVYALAPFRRKLELGDGKTIVVEKMEGEVYWVSAQEHAGENIGTTDTHVLIVELKHPSTNRSQLTAEQTHRVDTSEAAPQE